MATDLTLYLAVVADAGAYVVVGTRADWRYESGHLARAKVRDALVDAVLALSARRPQLAFSDAVASARVLGPEWAKAELRREAAATAAFSRAISRGGSR